MQSIKELFVLICDQYDKDIDTKSFEEQTKLCNDVIERYSSLKEHTYAKVHQITTISKKRIVKPVNRLDPIRKLKVSNEVLYRIDKKIMELLTDIDIH